MTRGIKSGIAWLLTFFAATGVTLCQNAAGEQSASVSQLRGKRLFQMRCATCHGLDGLGGERAPDIRRQTEMSTDQALLNLLHDGIPQRGMPAFTDMAKEDRRAVVAYIRLLQGNSPGNSGGTSPADPIRGRELFFGKAGCSTCHQIAGQGQSIAEDITDLARDLQASEIREAILRPGGSQTESATTLAKDGRRFSGIIRNEDNASLQLQDADGRLYLFMKSSLASVQRKTGEPMPANYVQRLSPTELGDLVAYIRLKAGASNLPSSPSGKDNDNRNDEEPHAPD
jgi:putative heme-binding domain-containing protein